jgi:hypothetical protein
VALQRSDGHAHLLADERRKLLGHRWTGLHLREQVHALVEHCECQLYAITPVLTNLQTELVVQTVGGLCVVGVRGLWLKPVCHRNEMGRPDVLARMKKPAPGRIHSRLGASREVAEAACVEAVVVVVLQQRRSRARLVMLDPCLPRPTNRDLGEVGFMEETEGTREAELPPKTGAERVPVPLGWRRFRRMFSSQPSLGERTDPRSERSPFPLCSRART